MWGGCAQRVGTQGVPSAPSDNGHSVKLAAWRTQGAVAARLGAIVGRRWRWRGSPREGTRVSHVIDPRVATSPCHLAPLLSSPSARVGADLSARAWQPRAVEVAGRPGVRTFLVRGGGCPPELRAGPGLSRGEGWRGGGRSSRATCSAAWASGAGWRGCGVGELPGSRGGAADFLRFRATSWAHLPYRGVSGRWATATHRSKP